MANSKRNSRGFGCQTRIKVKTRTFTHDSEAIAVLELTIPRLTETSKGKANIRAAVEQEWNFARGVAHHWIHFGVSEVWRYLQFLKEEYGIGSYLKVKDSQTRGRAVSVCCVTNCVGKYVWLSTQPFSIDGQDSNLIVY